MICDSATMQQWHQAVEVLGQWLWQSLHATMASSCQRMRHWTSFSMASW